MENPLADHFKLKWNNHQANFVQTFTDHQHGEYLVDVTLSCGGQYIKAHKLILASCSEYFDTIFKIHSSIPHPIIFLNGVQFRDLKYLLDFMYSGEVKVLDKHLTDVLELGKTLQVKGISGVVMKTILQDATPKETSVTACTTPKRTNAKKMKVANPAAADNPNQAACKMNEPPEMPPTAVLSNSNAENNYEAVNLIEAQPEVVFDVPPSPPSVTPASLPVIAETFSLSQKSDSKKKSILIPNSNLPNILLKKNLVSKPPHAFMIFASEWRKKLTIEHPDESTKQISVRLGDMWKTLLPETKNIYYREAQRAEEEHKRKYAELKETPKESVKRKAEVLSEGANSKTTVNGNAPTTFQVIDHVEVVETAREEHVAIIDSE